MCSFHFTALESGGSPERGPGGGEAETGGVCLRATMSARDLREGQPWGEAWAISWAVQIAGPIADSVKEQQALPGPATFLPL